MTNGDAVRVWPHGKDKQASSGTVVLISGNQRSILVAFDDRPAWSLADGFALHPEMGIVLVAMRQELNGKPWGPWVDQFGGGHFEIEEEAS